MICKRCGHEMEGPRAAFLDQCDLTRLPASEWTCPKCPEPVVVTVATGEPWQPYPAAKEKHT